MRGRVGTQTTLFSLYPPSLVKKLKYVNDVKLTREAKARLSWIEYYEKEKNVSKTCRRCMSPVHREHLNLTKLLMQQRKEEDNEGNNQTSINAFFNYKALLHLHSISISKTLCVHNVSELIQTLWNIKNHLL